MTGALFDVPKAKASTTGGPVYQGVCAAIRTLQALNADADADAAHATPKRAAKPGAAWAARRAGVIAQARSIAGSIDRASGHDPERRQAAGRDLASLHEQLAAALLVLDPEDAAAVTTPALDALQASWGAPTYTTPPDERVP